MNLAQQSVAKHQAKVAARKLLIAAVNDAAENDESGKGWLDDVAKQIEAGKGAVIPFYIALDALVALAASLVGITDDYMTSEQHHPGYVLIPAAKFEQLCAVSKEMLTCP